MGLKGHQYNQAQNEVPSLQVVPGTPEDSEIGGSGSSERGPEKGTPGSFFFETIL